MVQNQWIDFYFADLDHPPNQIFCDHPFISISYKSRSILPIENSIRWVSLKSESNACSPNMIKSAIQTIRLQDEWNISPEMASLIEDEYVEMRRRAREDVHLPVTDHLVDENALSRLMNISRLWGRLKGEVNFSQASWKEIVDLATSLMSNNNKKK